jgi:hypothetical protein
MLAGTVLDQVCSKNDLEVIMKKKINFSEHVDVMVGKAFLMLGLGDPEVSLHALASSEAGIRQLCMEPIL